MSIGSCHMDPTSTDSVSTTAKASVGKIYEYKGDLYRYMQADDAAWVAGDVLNPADAAWTEATKDRAGGTAISATVTCGVAVVAVADASYGYILIDGVYDGVATDGGVAAGDYLVAHSVDGQADTMADGEEEQVFGYALEADSSAGYVKARVRIV